MKDMHEWLSTHLVKDETLKPNEIKITEGMFPKKAVDFNKLKNKEGFWNSSIDDIRRMGALRSPQPKTIADMIFWLNMAADAWERTNK